VPLLLHHAPQVTDFAAIRRLLLLTLVKHAHLAKIVFSFDLPDSAGKGRRPWPRKPPGVWLDREQNEFGNRNLRCPPFGNSVGWSIPPSCAAAARDIVNRGGGFAGIK